MFRIMILAAALVCLAGASALAQAQQPVVVKMGNGLTVILQEDHAAELVGVDVWVKAGSGDETPEINGVSHLIEHLVFASTQKRQPGEVDREMESLGATLDAHTSYDWAHFNTTVSSRYLSKALDVLADVVSGAQFRDVDLERERPVILQEIARKQTEPMIICRNHLAKEIYGNHPYSLPIEGTEESVKNITRQDILDYYKKRYTAGNMAVVLVGDIDAQQALAEVGKAFERLPKEPAPERPVIELAPPAARVEKSIKAPYRFNYLALGFLGPKASDYEDICAMDTLLTYFGFGYRSWMSAELKSNMKFAVDIDVDFLTQREPGLISIIAATTPENTQKARDAIFAQLAKLAANGISQPELDLAKRSLLGQYAFQNETYGGRANTRGFYFTISEPDFASRYVSCVQAVTNADIMRVAKKYLNTDSAVVLTVGPQAGGSN